MDVDTVPIPVEELQLSHTSSKDSVSATRAAAQEPAKPPAASRPTRPKAAVRRRR